MFELTIALCAIGIPVLAFIVIQMSIIAQIKKPNSTSEVSKP